VIPGIPGAGARGDRRERAGKICGRDAAEAVRCRIDFKHVLGLELDDPGFHHSVLGDFRDRLLEDGRADRGRTRNGEPAVVVLSVDQAAAAPAASEVALRAKTRVRSGRS